MLAIECALLREYALQINGKAQNVFKIQAFINDQILFIHIWNIPKMFVNTYQSIIIQIVLVLFQIRSMGPKSELHKVNHPCADLR